MNVPPDPPLLMTEILFDQAAGLRRLLAQSALRTITVASATPRCGRTLVTANLAVALARRGHGVLLLDCASGQGSAAALLGAQPRADLLLAARGVADPGALAAEGAAGVRVVQVRALAAALEQSRSLDPARLAQALDTLREGADIVLVDAPPADLAWGSASRELVLLVGPGAQAMTGSYRLIKRLQAGYRRQTIHILVTQPHSSTHADRIFGNLSATSRRFLNLPLASMGHILNDEHVLRAAQLRQPVVEAFPDADCAQALRACAETLSRCPHPGEDALAEFATRLVETARTPAAAHH